MKNLFLIITLLITAVGFAQAPEKMNYQAIVRNADGNLVSEKSKWNLKSNQDK